MLGKYSYGGTPRHIPNLEVKPIYAESTWLEATWEDMNLPSFFFIVLYHAGLAQLVEQRYRKP